MNRFAIAIIPVVVAFTLAAANADAQVPHTGTRGGGLISKIPAPGGGPEARSEFVSNLTGQVQANLNRLEEDLRINAAQQKAWDAYATRVIRLADDVARARFAVRDLEGAAVTAPQLFDRITETAQNRLTAVEEIAEAGRELYARLSQEQRTLADRRLALLAMSLASGARTDDPPSPSAKPRSP